MGKYIFLTGHYLPKPGATGTCVHQLAKETAKRGNDVTTICYADGDPSKQIDGVKIVKVKTPSFYNENMSNSATIRRLNHIRSLMSKLVHIRKYPLRSMNLVRHFCAALEELIIGNERAVLIASVNPIEAVIAADRVKKKYPEKVKTIYYCADTLSNEKGDDGILSAEYRTKCGIRWEKGLFESFDKVMIMECHKEHYFSEKFSGLTDKMEIANFPLFTKLEVEGKKRDDDTIQFTYAGTLYRVLRNPEYLCELLIELAKNIKIHVSFLGGGDCDDIIDDAARKTKGAIEKLGMQPHSVAMQYLGEADVLLSIGNAESPMAPSKIFEYMSTGKPIIHVYTYEKDPCIEPLRRYGNALLIRDGDTEGLERIRAFISDRKQLKFEDVKKNFELSTPEYSVDIIERI